MSTSLAAQLQKFAVPSTNVLKETKKRPTLIFDPKEAASINTEVIYEIALEGLEKLIQKNDEFAQFKTSLFHPSSRDFDRNVQTKLDNKKLDYKINKFLLLLAPYVLMNPAHKALEWLYFRYRVNEYNRDKLILLVLPYYSSNIFIRLIQTLKFNETSDPFYFLNITKSGAHLQRLDLFYQALSNHGIIKSLSEYLGELIEVHSNYGLLQTHFSFYSTVFCGAIELSNELTDSFVTQLIPLVLKGLNSPIPDFAAGSYIIVARLLSKGHLSDKLLNCLVEKAADFKCPSLKLEASLLLVLTYQLQSQYKELPDKCLKQCSEWVGPCLGYLYANGNSVGPFLGAVIRKAVTEEDGNPGRMLLWSFVKEVSSDVEFFQEILRLLLDALDEEATLNSDVNQWATSLIQYFEQTNQSDLDFAVGTILRDQGLADYKKAFLKTISSNFSANLKVLDALEGNITEETLENLELKGKYVLTDALLKKLKDKQPKVVENTLKLILRGDWGDIDTLKHGVKGLFESGKILLEKWFKSYLLAAEFLLKNQAFDWDLLLTVVPFVLTFYKKHNDKIRSLFKVEPNLSIEKFIAELIESLNIEKLPLCLTIQPSSTKLFSALYVLSLIIPKLSLSDVPEILKIFDMVTQKDISKKPTDTLEAQLQIALKNKIPCKLIENCFRKLWLLDPKAPSIISALCNLAFNNEKLLNLFTIFLTETSSDCSDQLNCCINICVSGNLDDATCLKVLNYVSENLVEEVLLPDNIVLGLLALFFHTNKDIRVTTFDVASKLNKIRNDKYKKLLDHIKTYKREIVADQEQLPLICFNFLCKHSDILNIIVNACCSDTPLYIKAKILQILSPINNHSIFEKLCNYFVRNLDFAADLDRNQAEIMLNMISRIDETIAAQLKLKSYTWEFIFKVLNMKKHINIGTDKVYLPNALLMQLSKDIHLITSMETLEKLLDVICEVTALAEDPELIVTTSKIFKHIDLDANLVIAPLKKMVEVQSAKSPATKRARKHFSLPTIDILDTLEWKKGVCVLEFIQGKKKIRNCHLLLPVLFSTLKRCLDFEEQTAVEYPKQLILSAILLVFGKSEEKQFSDNDFNVELVIQCIRASQNPQTHYYALLVLSHAAKFIPNEVLNHIMTVFTFMGTTLVRHDDAYSFDIISKLIDGIVPVLVDGNHVTTLGDVLRVFVDALLDVPEHRRAPLYLKLLEKTKVEETFHLFLLLTLEAEVFQTGREKRKNEKGTISERIEFALLLCEKFPPSVALHACVKMTEYLKTLPDEKDNTVTDPSLTKFNAKQYRHYKYLIVTYLSKLLCYPPFVNKISSLGNEDTIKLEQSYKKIIVNILSYIQRVQRVSEKSSGSPQGMYWKTVLYHSYDLLDHVNDLLTPHMFLLVINGLLQHSILTVRKKALELLNNKLQSNLNWFTVQDEEQLFNILKPLLLIIKSVEEEENLQLEQETLVQTALLSLKLIAKRLGAEEPEKFLPILEFVAEILNSGKARDNLLASVILCLAELCVVLRAHGIQALSLFMPSFLSVLKSQKYQETSSMLLLSVLTTVCKLLESFAAFLSPYLKKLLVEISILSSKWDMDTADPKTQALVGRLQLIKKRLASVIPPRILLPIIDECFDSLLKKKYFNALVALVDILEEQLKNLQSNELGVVMAEMTQFSLKILQFRSEYSGNLEVANLVEDQTVKTITTFVLKLSESSFRPFYLKLYDWAVRTPSSNRERQITFYHLSESIGRSLKGLFVLFAGSILSNLAEILRDARTLFKDNKKSILLLTYVLRTLEVIFTYDNKKLINRDNFELLMQPMVDLLETELDGIDNLVKNAETLIIPTIVQFSVAVADDTLWKEMNYQILLKMRNSNAEIRLIALKCLGEVVGKLREDFLPLLPETIPFLAELLEDEDERVEKACQKTIREMEKMLGEPLQKYF
ncbi:HEAT repeat-containing protein 1 [Anthonomus grandis grandis]|uniref:HEAT repeat-containing protein 1 n=1 Tax=Anthonomus grandis grandis TaxID=2921223 RepID=UPI0021665FB6|nr:HEAT repeat-containing protein 1 [Anthonomus grandis grandis]